jgi:beta-lactamase regulating signal transducer with metallopeptidase domain
MRAIADFSGADALVLLGANVLTQILLVVLLAWALTRIVARRDPAVRHGIWVCALFCVLASPAAAWIMDATGITLVAIPLRAAQLAPPNAAAVTPGAAIPLASRTGTPQSAADSLDGLPNAPSLSADASGPWPSSAPGPAKSLESASQVAPAAIGLPSFEQRPLPLWGRTSLRIMCTVWAAGTLLLLARLIYGCLAIRSLRRELSWVLPPLLGEARRDASRVLGVDRLPPVALTSATTGPFTMGLLRPVVVLPANLMDQLNRQQLRDVLVHEFSHALRRDTVVGLLQRLAAVLFWPHPMVHLLNRELAEAREALCDNFVLRQAEAPDYAETLVLIAEGVRSGPRPAMVALLERRGGLERRVAGLLDERRKVTTRLHRGMAVAFMAAFFAIACLVAGTRLYAAPKQAADAEARRPAAQPPLTLDLAEFCPAKKFSRHAIESYAGRHTIDGLPFEVRSQIFLYGQTPAMRGQRLPEILKGIRIGRTFDELHLIHHTSWPGVDGEAVAYLELNYADGTKAILPVHYGRHVLDWSYLPSYEQETPTDPNTKVCWRHPPLQYLAPVRLFKSMLRNPAPTKVVETMNVVSARHLASYVLLAATVADRDPTRPVTPPVPATQPPWKFDRELKIEVVDAVTGKPVPDALVAPSLSVLNQGVVGSPFYTSAAGKGTIRYPLDTTDHVAFSVTKEGYHTSWNGWQGRVPAAVAVKLTPQARPGTASSGSLLGTFGRLWRGKPTVQGPSGFAAPPIENEYLAAQLREAKAGNFWAKYRVWAAYHKGTDGVPKNPQEADKWLKELVQDVHLATFRPVHGFAPQTPGALLAKFHEYSSLHSEARSIGGTGFFRTRAKNGVLIGSFLTAYPEQMRKAIAANPSLELISIEKLTPAMFIRHEGSPQESLDGAGASTPSPDPSSGAKKLAHPLPPLAASVPRPTSVHLVGKMRTLPRDNFSLIVAEAEFVPIEIWRMFGEKPRWRVEKPGRVIAMDGVSTAMLIKPNLGVKFPRPSFGAFDSASLLELADIERLIARQVRQAQASGGQVTQTRERTPSGEDRLLVTIEQKAAVPPGDHNKNKWFYDSDLRWVYRLDAKTHRLEYAEADLHLPGGDVQILKTERVEYDRPIDPAVFALKFPADTVWHREPQRLPDNAKYEQMSPLESARTFFEACSKEDWEEAEKFFQLRDERIKKHLGRLQIVSLGTPFRSQSYAGWYIPYEIRLRIQQPWSVRNDNPAKRWIVSLGPAETIDLKALADVKKLPNNEKYERMTPQEAVQAFVDACRKNQPAEAKKFLPPSIAAKEVETLVKHLAQAETHVGQCTPRKQPGQWDVSCELCVTRKHNLAMRNDNPAKRYVVDGGL